MSYLKAFEIYSDFTQGPAEVSGTGRAFLCWDWGYLCLLGVLGLPPAKGATHYSWEQGYPSLLASGDCMRLPEP